MIRKPTRATTTRKPPHHAHRPKPTPPTIQGLAADVRKAFIKIHADKDGDGGRWTLRDGSPDWMRDLVMDAHRDGSMGFDGVPGMGMMFPDDWRYEFIVEALDAIENASDRDLDNGDVRLEADIYTHDLLTWLASRIDRTSYCDDAMNEGLVSINADMVARISAGQYTEKNEVFALVYGSLCTQMGVLGAAGFDGTEDDVGGAP
jgi:hypothetical protein